MKLSYVISAALFIMFALSLVTKWDEQFVIALNLLILLNLLNNLGRSIVLREIVALYTSFSCLFMPLIGYNFYNIHNKLASIWGKYMPIPRETYFDFTVPAVIGFVLVLCFPIKAGPAADWGTSLSQTVDKAKAVLAGRDRIGIALMLAGISVTAVVNFLPVSLQFFFNLLYFSSFAGLLYVYFSPSFRYKKIVMLAFAAFIISTALSQGMFTVVVYMGMTLFPFFFIGKKIPLWRKLTVFVVGVFVVALIQSVKPAYRMAIWKNKYQGSNVELFGNLLGENLKNPKRIFSPDEFFFIYYRTNQGYNVSLVMKHIPAKKPFDEGENVFVSIASSLVPRFLWPDKPEAGGKFNMKYYTGYTIKGFATNVGPLGEAYGSFGVAGGIVFMILLALVIRFIYRKVFLIGQTIPLILFWLPVLFYQVTYSAENDTLQVLNSLLKTSFFIYLLYKFLPILFIPDKLKEKFANTRIRRKYIIGQS